MSRDPEEMFSSDVWRHPLRFFGDTLRRSLDWSGKMRRALHQDGQQLLKKATISVLTFRPISGVSP